MGVAAIVVSWDDPEATLAAAASIAGQTIPVSQLVVVDNHPTSPMASTQTSARVISHPENRGFASGVMAGVRATDAEWLFVLNPDATAAPDCLKHLLNAASSNTAIVGAQVLLPDGRVNAGDNPVHLTGITTAGHLGGSVEDGAPRKVASVSGAAMLIRRSALEEVGGMAEDFFLYHEDVDICWRLRLAGWDVLFDPKAHVSHNYAFAKGAEKWFYLERNRMWTVLSCYSTRSLALVAPLLIGSEIAIVIKALREGWWREKLRAMAAVIRHRRTLARRRREVQSGRRVSDGEILRLMTGRLESPLLSSGATASAGPLMEMYRHFLRALSP